MRPDGTTFCVVVSSKTSSEGGPADKGKKDNVGSLDNETNSFEGNDYLVFFFKSLYYLK